MLRRSTKYIAIHCSATRPALDVGVKEIRQWHKNQGWEDIGYHFVIRRDGRVEKGRPVDNVGAHVAGYNSTAVGVCLVGGVSQKDYTKPENNFTPEQWTSLKTLVASLVAKYPGAVVWGHRDFPKVQKACPSFDAKTWAKKNGFPT